VNKLHRILILQAPQVNLTVQRLLFGCFILKGNITRSLSCYPQHECSFSCDDNTELHVTLQLLYTQTRFFIHLIAISRLTFNAIHPALRVDALCQPAAGVIYLRLPNREKTNVRMSVVAPEKGHGRKSRTHTTFFSALNPGASHKTKLKPNPPRPFRQVRNTNRQLKRNQRAVALAVP
jgi:hypothetical protein